MEHLVAPPAMGDVVWGRVTGFPWWPAVAGRCPESGTARAAGIRTWVFFFNHGTGAWLSLRDLRGMREWTQEKAVALARKDKRVGEYLPDIELAAELAIEFLETKGRSRPLKEFSATLTDAAFEPVTLSEPATSKAPADGRGQKRSRTPEQPDREAESGRKIPRSAEERSAAPADSNVSGSVPLRLRLSHSRRADYRKQSPSTAISSGEAQPARIGTGTEVPAPASGSTIALPPAEATSQVGTGDRPRKPASDTNLVNASAAQDGAVRKRQNDEGGNQREQVPMDRTSPSRSELSLDSNRKGRNLEVAAEKKVTLSRTMAPGSKVTSPGTVRRADVRQGGSRHASVERLAPLAPSARRTEVIEETIIDGSDVPDPAAGRAAEGLMPMSLDVKASLAAPVSPSASPTPLPPASRYNLSSPLVFNQALRSPDLLSKPGPPSLLGSAQLSQTAAGFRPAAGATRASGPLRSIFSPRARASRQGVPTPPMSLNPTLSERRQAPVTLSLPDVQHAQLSPRVSSPAPRASQGIAEPHPDPVPSVDKTSMPVDTLVASPPFSVAGEPLEATRGPAVVNGAGRSHSHPGQRPATRPVTAVAAVNNLLGRPTDQARMSPVGSEEETAATLTASVESVVRASEEFARGYAYNPAAIGRAVERLFPDTAPGVPDHKSRMARQAAHALVMKCLP